jgi:hypothetical protein
METSLENFLTVLQFLYSMTRGMTLTLSDSTAQLFACKQSTLKVDIYLFCTFSLSTRHEYTDYVALSQMASWKHDVCKLRSYYSFSTLFLWAVAWVWVYDEFINSNWQFAVTNNRLTFVSFHIVFLSFCRSWENVTPAPAYKILHRSRENRRSSGRTPAAPAHSTNIFAR